MSATLTNTPLILQNRATLTFPPRRPGEWNAGQQLMLDPETRRPMYRTAPGRESTSTATAQPHIKDVDD
jgi:hypothetical protein